MELAKKLLGRIFPYRVESVKVRRQVLKRI